MTTYVAFLRAINLGANRKFPKGDIVASTTAAGFSGVVTHINTGNVRLETSLRSRAKIEAALEAAYVADRGFEVPTFVFSQAELRGVGEDADRFAAGYEGRHYVSLLKDEPTSASRAAIEARATEFERVYVCGRAVHLLLDEGYGEAVLTNATVEKLIGVATNRNVTVIRALVQKWC